MAFLSAAQRDVLAARNVLYIDTEAELTSGEAGGFTPKMGVSILGLFDYRKWRTLGGLRFATTPADTQDVLGRRPAIWSGHNLVRYDLGVMFHAGYLDDLLTPDERKKMRALVDANKTNSDLGARLRTILARRDIEIIDTLELGQDLFGFRPKLDGLLTPQGFKKLDAGIEAPGMARRGEWGRLCTYLAGDVRGGMTVLEMFLGADQIEYSGRQGDLRKAVGESWRRRRADILVPPRNVQQGMFDGR